MPEKIMIDSPKNTHINLSNLGRLLKEKMTLVKSEGEQIESLKEEIRGIMIENDLKNFENREMGLRLKITRPKSFDFGLFKLEYPKLRERYFTEETITTIKDVYDKKKIKAGHPKEYEACEVELTPRLTVK